VWSAVLDEFTADLIAVFVAEDEVSFDALPVTIGSAVKRLVHGVQDPCTDESQKESDDQEHQVKCCTLRHVGPT
jgi:predicted transcriptional regulator